MTTECPPSWLELIKARLTFSPHISTKQTGATRLCFSFHLLSTSIHLGTHRKNFRHFEFPMQPKQNVTHWSSVSAKELRRPNLVRDLASPFQSSGKCIFGKLRLDCNSILNTAYSRRMYKVKSGKNNDSLFFDMILIRYDSKFPQ